MATRYEMAEKLVWAKLENWQKTAITQDRAEKTNSSVFQQFTEQVVALAESVSFIKDITPSTKKSKKDLTSSKK